MPSVDEALSEPTAWIPFPVRLIVEGSPAAMALYAAVAAGGGTNPKGCSLTISSLAWICGVCDRVVRRELAWLARSGWITQEHRSGYSTLRHVADPTIASPAQ